MPIKIAINGFGRIGRIFFRQAFGKPGFDIVAVNDLGSAENLAYLLKYDSVYGRYNKEVKSMPRIKPKVLVRGQKSPKESLYGDPTGQAKVKSILEVDGKEIKIFQEKDPAKLPWKELDIDVAVESTGVFTSYEKAKGHLEAGAKRVVITAPAKDDGEIKTFTPNVGVSFVGQEKITANASCTTNAVTPVAAILMKNPGIKKAVLNTVHGYTASQGIVDGPDDKDFRRGRAAAVNIVPSSTGAAVAAEKALPELKGIFDGVAMRVPVVSGSIIDFTFLAARKTSVEEINAILRQAAESPEWQGIVRVSEEPLVSTDILAEPYGSVVDLTFTRVVDGDLVKVLSWYDNEWGYGAMLIKHIETLKKLL